MRLRKFSLLILPAALMLLLAVSNPLQPQVLAQQPTGSIPTVTGTPVGCACGQGVLDWERIIGIVRQKCPRDIVFSVECGTPTQAAKSLEHLRPMVA